MATFGFNPNDPTEDTERSLYRNANSITSRGFNPNDPTEDTERRVGGGPGASFEGFNPNDPTEDTERPALGAG